MGGAKLMNVTKHSPDSWKENMLSLLTSLGKGYCCILLPQIRPAGKVLSSQIAFWALMMRIAMCLWHDVMAGGFAPIPPIQNLFSQNQLEIANTGKQIIMFGRPEVLSQSLPRLGKGSLLFTRNR